MAKTWSVRKGEAGSKAGMLNNFQLVSLLVPLPHTVYYPPSTEGSS